MKKLCLITMLFGLYFLKAQTPIEIIKTADSKLKGNSSYAEMSITIVRPKWKKK